MTCLTFLVAYALVGLCTALTATVIALCFVGLMEVIGAVALGVAVVRSKREARMDFPKAQVWR